MLRTAARRVVPSLRSVSRQINTETFGQHQFTGHVADKYLRKYGESAAVLNDPSWVTTCSDKVAAAVLDWGLDNGATVFTHLWQPLGSSGVRHGLTGSVQNSMFTFVDGQPVFALSGKELIRGETDGSSFQNGGLRATHTAGGYLVIDPTSPIFLRGDTVFANAGLISWAGHSIDEKVPLLRAQDALSKAATKLLGQLGFSVDGVVPNIGLEQEYFLIPRSAYARRPDLQLAGRTVLGKNAPRGQEMCDHYMGPLNQHALKAVQAAQEECYKMGIPLRTRHREVAPNQYENAPMYGVANVQIDQNLIVMQVLEEVAAQYGLACLHQEKPFSGINGSGKHNNFSLGTTCGVNLLNPQQLTKASGNAEAFPVLMAAIVQAVAENGDLMRMAIASPGNDFRLGACEAPPAIMSTYLGDDMTSYLTDFKSGTIGEYVPKVKTLETGCEAMKPFPVPAEDRNRTSPFPYGGNRFEFRAVGSSQNTSMVNTVLCTIFADAFTKFSAAIEGGAKPSQVAADALNKNWNVIFNGDNYSQEWPVEAKSKGLFQCDSGVEAMSRLKLDKNIKIFEDMKVLSREEAVARTAVMHAHYASTVEIEALTMIDMFKQGIIPVVADHASSHSAAVTSACASVEAKLAEMHGAADEESMATIARELRLEVMEEARKASDAAEADVPTDVWPFATYKELLFLDSNQDAFGNDC